MTLAWYLRCGPEHVADRAIIVGDRGRVALAASQLEEPRWLNEDRGLTTVTGMYKDTPVTVSAFGMGAPIAAIVVDELAQLGVRTVLRLGTAMSLAPVALGDLVVAEAAVREESTSATYVPPGYPASADAELSAALAARGHATGRSTHTGLIASYDGFYTQMFPGRRVDTAVSPPPQPPGVLALDMETSAILAIGRCRGIQAASLCAATIAAETAEQLPDDARAAAERDAVEVGIEVLASC